DFAIVKYRQVRDTNGEIPSFILLDCGGVIENVMRCFSSSGQWVDDRFAFPLDLVVNVCTEFFRQSADEAADNIHCTFWSRNDTYFKFFGHLYTSPSSLNSTMIMMFYTLCYLHDLFHISPVFHSNY